MSTTKLERPRSVFPIGHKLLIVAQENIFAIKDNLMMMTPETVLAGLYFVELTVIRESVVSGNYQPDQLHCGYLAQGSDGYEYHSQWDTFDDTSMNPYGNWQWHCVEGIHYKKAEPGTKNQHGLDKTLDFGELEDWFAGHYLNWEITHMAGYLPPIMIPMVIEHVNKTFPDCQIGMCDVLMPPREDQPEPRTHGGNHTFFYLKKGCHFCNYLGGKNEAEGAAARREYLETTVRG